VSFHIIWYICTFHQPCWWVGCVEQQNICVTFILKLFQVIISWVSFWLDHTAVLARIILGFTTLLTMTMQVALSWYSAERVKYSVHALFAW
jgi:hypothetical protein